MKQNIYEIEKNVEKILRGSYTGFLNSNIRKNVQNRLKKNDYKIFKPFEEAEKVILYSYECPQVRLFKITCYKTNELKHSSIMGSLFGLNITNEKFGDIVLWNNNFYVYLVDDISSYVVDNLTMIGNISVNLEEVPLELLEDFKRKFEKIELIVSSLRIDTIISRLIGCNRDSVGDKLRNNEIYLNDEIPKKSSEVLDEGDIFSIRKFGKYRFEGIVGRTKKDNFIISIDKYI